MKIVKILNCKNSLILGLLFVVTFFPILMIMPNAHAELSIIKNENNSLVFEDLNKKTTTTNTTTNATLENDLDNKTIFTQEGVSQITQLNDTEIGNNNSSIPFANSTQSAIPFANSTQSAIPFANSTQSAIPFANSTQNKESGQSHPEVLATQGNVTIQDSKNSDFTSPTVSYIENEGSQRTPLNYENNYRGFNSNEDDNSESRDKNVEINPEIREEKKIEEDSKDAETNEEIEEDSKEAETNEEIEEDSKDAENNEKIEEDSKDAETNEEIEEDSKDAETNEEIEEDSKDAETNDNILKDNYKLVNSIPTQNENENKIKGAPVDNENKKLLSQFTQVNSSSVMPELHIQSEKSNSTFNDNKLVANAGLDQILNNEARIVLDASSSFSSNGNISNFLWKQLGDTKEKIAPSNSMIYSFPTPDEIEENPLEFELTVMDKNGQKASDTVKIMLADENYLEDRDTD